jgi:hypothetical protein
VQNTKVKKVAGAITTVVAPSGSHADAETLRIPIHGIRDKNILQQIAKDIHQEIARGELGGSIETENLASFGGDNQDPDLIRLRPGDTVELLNDIRPLESKLPLVNILIDQERLDFESAVAAIKSRIGDDKLARAIVATSRSFELIRFFRVANVRFNWSIAGLSLAFDYQNYFVPRQIPPPSEGPITKRPKHQTATVDRK